MAQAAIACIVIANALPRAAVWVFCTGLVLFSGWQWQWTYVLAHGEFDRHFAETRWQMVRESYVAFGEEVSGKQLAQIAPGGHLRYSILAFEYLKSNKTPPSRIDTQIRADIDQHRRAILGSEIVLTFSPDFTEIIPNFAASARQFQSGREYGYGRPPIRISHTFKGGAAIIYRARPIGFSAFISTENLGPISGPFPESNMLKVRWGHGDKSTLAANGPAGTKAILFFQARAHPDQTFCVREGLGGVER